jgi:protein-disulfide isomerase
MGPFSPRVMTILALLGALSVLLSVFLWWQLFVSHAGGTPLCGFGEEGACAALWDSRFAARVHQSTGVPVAGWGLVWGLAAMVLPLVVRRRPADSAPAWVTAVRLVALVGVAATVLLAAVAVGEGVFCTGCVATYLLVAAYAWVAFVTVPGSLMPDLLPAGWIALGAFGVGYLLTLYPGTQTPQSPALLGYEAIVAGAGEAPAADPTQQAGEAPDRDAMVRGFLDQLNPQGLQLLADTLQAYRNASAQPIREPRFVIGPADAPVRLTDFTDPLCPACADLHANLEVFRQSLPPGSFSVEPRQFPLDGTCNPVIPRQGDGVRCLAAKAEICLEGRPGFFEYQKAVFSHQQGLTAAQVFDLAQPYVGRGELESCIASRETQDKLLADVQYAQEKGITGTPLVLINGRPAPHFAPLYYVLILTGGDPDHPALAALPPPAAPQGSG